MRVRTVEEAIKRYGVIKDRKWTDASKWCSVLKVPDHISAVWINSATGKPTKSIYCNNDMKPFLLKALSNVFEHGYIHELKTFDGCWSIRCVRGSDKPSTHSYALAIDINAKENQLGMRPKLSTGFVKCFEDEGFDWGGRFTRLDPMHFSLAWETPHLI